MSTILTQLKYTQLARGIREIITRGREDAKKALHQKVLKTNWEVGQYLSRNLPPSDGSAVKQLAALTGQDETYLYMSLKLYRYYPKLPKDTPDWTWSHYLGLLSVNDPKKRARYEKQLKKKWMNSMQFKALVLMDKKQEQAKIPVIKAPGKAPRLVPGRGKLYHYYITRPKKNEKNAGFITVDVGFKVMRTIPADPKIKYEAGMIVETTAIPGGQSNQRIIDPRGWNKDAAQNFKPTRSKTSSSCLYTYKAAVTRVTDGDTLWCEIDLGLYTKTTQKLRLRGIDCPEMSTPRGIYVRNYVKKLLDKQEFIIVKTYKDDKYGRMLGDIFYLPKEKDAEVVAEKGTFINQHLLDKGMAELWIGKGDSAL